MRESKKKLKTPYTRILRVSKIFFVDILKFTKITENEI